MYEKIMVAYDDSVESRGALEEALDLAVTFKAQLFVASVLEPIPALYQMASIVAPEVPRQLADLQRQQLEDLQTTALTRALNRGIEGQRILREGDEVEQLVAAAQAVRPDLLVLGLHKHDAFARWVGTAHLVAQAMDCSVLAVRRRVSASQ